MHQFVRDENNEWTMPDKSDCISCGRYKVGGTQKAVPDLIVEEPEPLYITEQKLTYHLPAMDIPYALTHNDNMIIRTKSHEDKVVVTYRTTTPLGANSMNPRNPSAALTVEVSLFACFMSDEEEDDFVDRTV
ncbi:hypothetical protein L596_023015 [Steinernema carpocapsae]|uniref:Uncharacterized protein n=1 Tax=Steinernema carpocapsae TaxID=34508 RepID=A0A4U5MD77_STECR|nr:hypothetical protein L596_023015 [Steinernema carpocapsae]